MSSRLIISAAPRQAIDRFSSRRIRQLRRVVDRTSFSSPFLDELEEREPGCHAFLTPGFSIEGTLQTLSGPLIEIAGPTPVWRSEAETWSGVDMQKLPRPLWVTNLLPNVHPQVLEIHTHFGRYAFQSDATEMPVRSGSVAAFFASAFSIPEENGRGDFPPGDRVMMIYAAMYQEVFRCLRRGGIFHHVLISHPLADLGLFSGFEVVQAEVTWKPGKVRFPYGHFVTFQKPR